MRHLAQVERNEPHALPLVFAERRQTVESSMAYLETLATSYQRLSPPPNRRECDLNALITDVVRAAQGHDHVELGTEPLEPPACARRSGRVPAYPREPDRERGRQPGVESGPHHRLDAGRQSRGRAAGGAGHGRRYRPRHVRRRGGADLRRLLHDEGARHRSRAVHRPAAGDGLQRHRSASTPRLARARASASSIPADVRHDHDEAGSGSRRRAGDGRAVRLRSETRRRLFTRLSRPAASEALEILAREPIDCVVLDLEMPGIDGFEVLRRLQQRGIDTPVIVYTGTGSYERCVQAVQLGAYGFVDKAEPIERVVQEIENAVSRGRLVKEVRSLRSRLDDDTPLVGESAPMRALRDAIARVAPIPSSVLIVGESGTGKELVARELHQRGTWREGAARRRQQRRAARAAGRERAVRPRARRVHRRRSAAQGRVRACERRNAVPRRGRRAAAAGAGQAPARARRSQSDAGRRRSGHPGDGARRRGHQPEPGTRGRGGPLPSGSLLSAQRAHAARAAAARSAVRHPGAGRASAPRDRGAPAAYGRSRSPRTPSRCSRPTIGGGTTSASFATAWSG